ncbi:proton channel OtopLc-like isoform X4 [Homalodisca vitripennis]|uniref:proton channel OtopLc-like isoform X4 n=1 Tax=Homalodisca vitripennis TaxID=197043 RepID=UPI001EEC4191|nr:proton channel OtopLc-like isoform X4 [Homalodisca vitripennis]
MLGGGEVKVATVEAVESVDNMATLPVSRAHGGSDITPEKNNFTNKEMEAKKRPVGAVPMQPKRTSLFIVLSFIYAKLLVVVCIAFVVSEVVTHSLPIPYYEGFFTYLYGVSILFLLYVFCFLLQESTCCQATEPKPKKPKKEKEKEKENKKNKKKEAADKKKEKEESAKGGGGGEPQPPPAQQGKRNSRSNIFQNEVYPRKMKDLMRSKNALVDDIESNPNSNSGSKSELVGGMMGTLRKGKSGADSPTQEKLTDSADVESCPVPMPHPGRKRKTSQNTHSHGSFFLRVGAIAFGLATMIYNGLEFGEFFEIPFTSPCYQVLRGVNPLLQMMFTFMQMYFIFMNSRLNIHRFKVIARFGLMHIVATNLCVWIRTLVLESLKEITGYLQKRNSTVALTTPTSSVVRNLNNDFAILATEPPVFWDEFAESPLAPAALVSANRTPIDPQTCGRVNIMGSIVQDSAPYLFPFIIEYSLIGAAVIYVMWRHIGRHASYYGPREEENELLIDANVTCQKVIQRYQGEEDLEQRLEVILSRRAVALAHANAGRVDCVGASKGLFFGLLLLVGSLICLILFFVLVHHPQLGLLAIYLADVSHCALMGLSIIAIIIGFIRVQGLKFQGEEQSDLNDILQRVSAFGLFVYAVFSVIAGALTALTSEPNLLVMITGNLSVVQVVLQLLFIADIARRRVHLPEHDRSKPGRQIVTFLLICNVTMWIIYTFETQKVIANPVQLDFYGFLAWSMVQRVTLPLCIFYRFHSAVTLAEIWKTSYKPRLD